jgi:zinc transport system substrate-binding protein
VKRLFALLLLLLICARAAAAPLTIYASVPPVAAIAAAVGGTYIQVHSLLRPGDNPVTFSPTPLQLAHLADSRLFLSVGVPFEHAWLPRIRAAAPALRVLDVRSGLALEPLPEHHHPGADAHSDEEEADPHVWNDPLAVVHMSKTIRDALIQADPTHAEAYRRQQAALADRLRALDTELRTTLAPYRGRSFLVFHPAWGYFARRYELQQLAIEHQGKQSGARWMKELIDRARREDIHVIVVQPQFDQRMAGQIAQAISGRVASVDPLSADYQDSLRRLARIIAGGGA